MKKHKMDAYYLKKYGITWKQRMDIWRDQKGRCAICNKHERKFKNRLAVDHNHKTGQVRGLLCFHCNRFLVGRLTLVNAWDVYTYLLKHTKIDNQGLYLNMRSTV